MVNSDKFFVIFEATDTLDTFKHKKTHKKTSKSNCDSGMDGTLSIEGHLKLHQYISVYFAETSKIFDTLKTEKRREEMSPRIAKNHVLIRYPVR